MKRPRTPKTRLRTESTMRAVGSVKLDGAGAIGEIVGLVVATSAGVATEEMLVADIM